MRQYDPDMYERANLGTAATLNPTKMNSTQASTAQQAHMAEIISALKSMVAATDHFSPDRDIQEALKEACAVLEKVRMYHADKENDFGAYMLRAEFSE